MKEKKGLAVELEKVKEHVKDEDRRGGGSDDIGDISWNVPTIGGMVQNFPLDSIGEFNFETQRFRADTGRSNGGTLKVVTKSGTNEFHGSAFELSATRA